MEINKIMDEYRSTMVTLGVTIFIALALGEKAAIIGLVAVVCVWRIETAFNLHKKKNVFERVENNDVPNNRS